MKSFWQSSLVHKFFNITSKEHAVWQTSLSTGFNSISFSYEVHPQPGARLTTEFRGPVFRQSHHASSHFAQGIGATRCLIQTTPQTKNTGCGGSVLPPLVAWRHLTRRPLPSHHLVQGLVLGVWCLGFGVLGSRCWVWGMGCRVWGVVCSV